MAGLSRNGAKFVSTAMVAALLAAACGTSATSAPASAAAGSVAPATSSGPAASSAAPATSSGPAASAATGGLCKLPNGKNGQFKVGIAIREMVNDVDRDVVAGATAEIQAQGGTVTVTDAGSDAQKQNDNVQSLITSNVDGLIAVLGDAQQLSPLTQQATSKGIKVSTALVGSTATGALTDVGWDDPLAAAMMTRALFSSIGYKGNVYVFWVPGAPILETRKRVLEAIAKDYPQITLHDVATEHGAAKSLSQMTDILTANPDKGSIAGVWGAYDLLVSGANQAIQRAGRSEIKVTGIDGDKITYQMLYQEGSPYVAGVTGDVPAIGKLAADAIIKASCGLASEVPPSTYTQMWVETRNNGVQAGEMRWGANLWSDLKLDKNAILQKYPQNQQVIVVQPVLPR